MNGTAEKIRMACDHIMKSGEGRPGVLYIRDNAERMLQAGWRFRLPYDDPKLDADWRDSIHVDAPDGGGFDVGVSGSGSWGLSPMAKKVYYMGIG